MLEMWSFVVFDKIDLMEQIWWRFGFRRPKKKQEKFREAEICGSLFEGPIKFRDLVCPPERIIAYFVWECHNNVILTTLLSALRIYNNDFTATNYVFTSIMLVCLLSCLTQTNTAEVYKYKVHRVFNLFGS